MTAPTRGSERSEQKARTPLAQSLLLVTAGWLAWRPTETFSSSAFLVAAVVLGLMVWGWQRTPPEAGRAGWWTAGAVCIVVASGVVGHDPSAAIGGGALLAVLGILIWLASREAPPAHWPAIFGLIVSGLAFWGLLQLTAGPEHTEAILRELPESLRAAALERLTAGRAFASQPLPSHLAVLLATALPLLLARLRLRWSAVPWGFGAGLCVVGLALTRSPIGIGLALLACGALATVRGGKVVRSLVLALGLVLVLAVMLRADVRELEPVDLRVDNWRTALWIWSTAPATGIGFGGFGQMAQAVPFTVGNRPRYAHSLPLEWLAELGPVGLLAILAAGLVLWHLMRDLWPRRPDLAVAIAVVPMHNLVDFSLHGSGVALPWAVLVGWAFAVRGPVTVVGTGPRGRPLAVTLAAVALAATILHATSVMVSDAARSRREPVERYTGALDARRLAPWRPDPLFEIAIAALETGNQTVMAEAAGELERGRWLRPNSAALADLRGRLAQARGRAPSAAAEAWTARHFHPVNPVYQRSMEQLVGRLEGDDDG